MQGSVRKIVDNRYGFIQMDHGEDMFFHCTELIDISGMQDLHIGDKVEFEVADGVKGPKAVKVRLLNRL